jgi:molybdate transport system substrate-binding protein
VSRARASIPRRSKLTALAPTALMLAWLALAGCGSGSGTQLDVSAAASLRQAFTRYGHELGSTTARFSFAGSDALAAQIEQGIHPDVFAAANTKLPDELLAKGLVEKPVVFAANRLVLAVPASSRIATLADVERPGVRLALGAPTVPVGAYAAKLMAALAPAARHRLLANVVDREPDVTGIVGKLSEGAIDAGLLYATDVRAAGGRLRAVALPAALQPPVAYGVAVVKGTAHAARARAFIAGLLHGAGRRELLRSGFLAPP